MREIVSELIIEKICNACMEAAFELPSDVMNALEAAQEKEISESGKGFFKLLQKNAKIAKEKKIPLCQDTGIAMFMVEIGSDVRIIGDSLKSAINKGMVKGYNEGFLRKSVVADPLDRKNTEDNSPSIIHIDLSVGDHLKIHFMAKGAGSENMSRLSMLKPSDGEDGIVDFVVNTVKEANANPCPPIMVGVGIGGNFEKAAQLSKKALFRKLGEKHSEEKVAFLEYRILNEINKLGIGPQGLGGVITALFAAVETYPCHMASLPVAVNINCHSIRRRTIYFKSGI